VPSNYQTVDYKSVALDSREFHGLTSVLMDWRRDAMTAKVIKCTVRGL
jgi:hypothetical protein